MLQVIEAYQAHFQLAVSVLTAAVWLAYLHLLLMGFLRQRQSTILISRGAGEGESARCFVTNMGAEPVYLIDVVADLETDDATHSAIVTDRDELPAERLSRPSEGTNQGPLDSGALVDIGSFGDVIWRARKRAEAEIDPAEIRALTLTAAAASGHSALVVAARRRYRTEVRGEARRFAPDRVMAEQIRARRPRKRLRRWLAAAQEMR